MATKHINCSSKCEYDWNVREVINQLIDILNADSVYFDSDGEHEQIDITVSGITANIGYFCPNTWEYVEEFVWKNIGFLIMCYELYKFPYYEELLDMACNRLGCTAEDLDVL